MSGNAPPKQDQRGVVRRWVDDLALGVRLAVGGSRTSWARLAVTAVGIGLGVAVLLVATSVGNVFDQHQARRYDRAISYQNQPAQPGVDAVLAYDTSTEFHGRNIQGYLLQPQGPTSPHPPGTDRLPKSGEYFVSPALRQLLESEDGKLLRPRFNGTYTTIADEGLVGPRELFFYAGSNDLAGATRAVTLYKFGEPKRNYEPDGLILLLVTVGSAVLLIPVVVFIGTSTRMSAAARDRRLAALRLVGADAQQTRRVAAGETLVGALLGLVVGIGLLLGGRQLVEQLAVSGFSVFAVDIRPSWPLAVLVLLGVPVLAVAISVLALRHTLVDPLGTVRQAKPRPRRLWWRLLPVVAGVGILLAQSRALGSARGMSATYMAITGTVLLLLGIPMLLPWVVERLVARMNGGAPSWQLAVRRMQLDSGTAGRIVGGLAVVLAGGIALQTMLLSGDREFTPPPRAKRDASRVEVSLDGTTGAASPQTVVASLGKLPGVREVSAYTSGYGNGANNNDYSYGGVLVAPCDVLRKYAKIDNCAQGGVWFVEEPDVPQAGSSANPPGTASPPRQRKQPKTGDVLYFQNPSRSGEVGRVTDGPQWTIPAGVRTVEGITVDGERSHSGFMATPGQVPDAVTATFRTQATLRVDQGQPDTTEHVRNAIGVLSWRAYIYNRDEPPRLDERQETFAVVRRGLLIGVLVALSLAAASLLVIGFDQVRERRRPLAVLAASGVPRLTLAKSVLWQTAVPVLVAVVVSVTAGAGLGALLLNTVERQVKFDWAGIGISSGAAVLAVLLVTSLTLPSVMKAMRPEGLRAE